MFDGLVGRYDLLNRVMSLGLDRRWRSLAVRSLGSSFGGTVLDLGCGTGDLLDLLATYSPCGAIHPPARVLPGPPALATRSAGVQIVGVDVSAAMLGRAKARLGGRVSLVRGSAFSLPFGDGTFQGAVSAFVLRNLRDLEGAMRELARVVAPGGTIGLLDATEPRGVMRPLFDVYFRVAAPALGALIGRKAAYQYLAGSLAQIPGPAEMCRVLEDAGFEDCRARALTLGVVTLFTARRAR